MAIMRLKTGKILNDIGKDPVFLYFSGLFQLNYTQKFNSDQSRTLDPITCIVFNRCNFSEHYSTPDRIGRISRDFLVLPIVASVVFWSCVLPFVQKKECVLKVIRARYERKSQISSILHVRSQMIRFFVNFRNLYELFWFYPIFVFCHIQWYSKYPSLIIVNPEKITNTFVFIILVFRPLFPVWLSLRWWGDFVAFSWLTWLFE